MRTDKLYEGYFAAIPSPTLHQRSSAGRKPKSSWHHLLPIVAAYMMTLDKRPGESRDHNAIAGMVLQLAREEDIKELPTIDAMKDVISKIFNRADEFSTQQ